MNTPEAIKCKVLAQNWERSWYTSLFNRHNDSNSGSDEAYFSLHLTTRERDSFAKENKYTQNQTGPYHYEDFVPRKGPKLVLITQKLFSQLSKSKEGLFVRGIDYKSREELGNYHIVYGQYLKEK